MWEHRVNYVFVVACVVGCAGMDLPQRLRIICICVSVSYCFLRVITSQTCLSIMTIHLMYVFFLIVYL